MHERIIQKNKLLDKSHPNLPEYSSFRSSFSWQNALNELEGLPDNKGLNIAYEAVDRHVKHGQGSKVALRFIGKEEVRNFTFQTRVRSLFVLKSSDYRFYIEK